MIRLCFVTDPYFLYDGSDTVYAGQAAQSMWPALMTWVTIYMFILAMDRELNQRNRIYYTDFSSRVQWVIERFFISRYYKQRGFRWGPLRLPIKMKMKTRG